MTINKVSSHAQKRYLLRVNAACPQPKWALFDLWQTGQEATEDDIRAFSIRRKSGSQYRVVKAHNGLRFILVARDNAIVTILEPLNWEQVQKWEVRS